MARRAPHRNGLPGRPLELARPRSRHAGEIRRDLLDHERLSARPAADDEGAAELLKTASETAQVGKRLGVARLNLHGTGLGEGGLPVTPCETVTGAMWLKARDTLNRIADLAEEEGVTFTLENLNLPVDHPGVPFGARGRHAGAGIERRPAAACASISTSTMRRSARGI